MRQLGALLIAVAAVLAGAPVAAADSTWSGASTSTTNWSDASNWAGGTGPSGAAGTLSFPLLDGCSASAACYASVNDQPGGNPVSADRLVVDDEVPYSLSGAPINLGAGGVQATAAPSTSGKPSAANLLIGLALTADQTWSVDGGSSAAGAIALGGPISGNHSLGVALADGGSVTLGPSDDEVGPAGFASIGAGGGVTAFNNGTLKLAGKDSAHPVSLNYTDSNPVVFSHVGVIAANAQLGPLITSAAGFEIGSSGYPSTLNVNGSVTLDSKTVIGIPIGHPGIVPGADFGQLSATGTVNLAGAILSPSIGAACPTLQVGDVETLVTTTGTLTGTFAGLPSGSTVIAPGSGSCTKHATLRIDYSPTSVTATVLLVSSGPPAPVAAPVISGDAAQGQVVSASPGAWANNPTSFIYQWLQCPGASDHCSSIAEATSPTYTVAPADVGHTLRVEVFATGPGGTNFNAVVSGPTAVVRAVSLGKVVPSGARAGLATVLKHRGYSFAVGLPGPGRLTVAWYPGLSRAHPIALSNRAVTRGGTLRVLAALTKAGLRVLRRARRLTITAAASFTPSGGRPVSLSLPVTLTPAGAVTWSQPPPRCPRRTRCLYVSSAGSDSATGTAKAPLRSIGQGLSVARGGETVYVAGGTYPYFRDSAARPAPVKVIGYASRATGMAMPLITSSPPGKYYLRASGIFLGASNLEFEHLKFLDTVQLSCGYPCTTAESHDITFAQDEFTNTVPATAVQNNRCVQIENGAYRISVLDSWIHNCDDGVFGGGHSASTPQAHDLTISHNVIEDSVDSAIQFGEWHNVTIDHNLMRDNYDFTHTVHEDGIQFVGLSSHIAIVDNVIHDTGQNLFVQAQIGPIDDLLVEGNLLYDSNAYAVQNQGATHTVYLHNTIWNPRYGAILLRKGIFGGAPTDTIVADNLVSTFGVTDGAKPAYEDYNVFTVTPNILPGPHDVIVPAGAPTFVDAAAGDYRLAPGAQAIAAGANAYASVPGAPAPPVTDLAGTPWGSPPSAGAYELAGR